MGGKCLSYIGTEGPGNIFALFFAVGALAMCFSIWSNYRLAGRIRPVTGALQDISYQSGRVGTSKASTYNITVHFTYQVHGTEYQGKLVSLRGNFYSSERDAERIVQELSGGKEVAVWYDPNHPSMAVLKKPEVEGRAWIILVVLLSAGFFCSKFLDILIFGLRRNG
jgi:hypothetical protein